ncbi:MAG: SRPBCC family protein [Panacagrimonas sp.]
MFKYLILVLAIVLGGVLAYAATRPDTFTVERRISIHAPPDEIFPLINDLHRFVEWSPYEEKDPSMNRNHSGAAAGVGAIYAWDGGGEVGQGSMEIVGATEPSHVAIQLDFVRPFQARNQVDFTLVPQGEATEVTWAMHGPSPYVSKVMGVFFNMDRMIGRDFEAGLARLKVRAES